MDYDGKFYIGKIFDPKSGKRTDENVLYDPDDLTTHGVVVGMTGSGKTGLCIDILEEAALNGIPALLVDPKGDIGNLLLHFPSLAPEDFKPWINADEARRSGKNLDELAGEVSSLWKRGLEEWGIDAQRIERVRQAVEYAVYTPGTDAGIPVSVLASLQAPGIAWDNNQELLREKISSTVTALLGLVGIEGDPVRSREHILLANIFEHAWSRGEDLALSRLIELLQRPPFETLGALDVERFFPADDRFKLAMLLNNLLASPSFRAWTEGVPLDIHSLLWTPDGRPRHSVFNIAHLSDNERMFFVTLLLSALETWVRTQPGSSSLRAMLYFDEVFGYLPPVAEPPSKGPMLRLLKQARAFGFGLLLATQNPVDIDYKALSNAGTWFVGRLQTEQDKARLLDGLDSAAAGQGGFNRKKADAMISALGKRAFLLHNVHAREPLLFQTRWAMAYLTGPITRVQIKDLNALVGAKVDPARQQSVAAVDPASEGISDLRPALPQGVTEFFLPQTLSPGEALKRAGKPAETPSGEQIVYHPVLMAQAIARYLDRKIDLEHQQTITAVVPELDPRGAVRWEEYADEPIDPRSLDRQPLRGASFRSLRGPLSSKDTLKRLESDFLDYVYHSAELRLPANETLGVVGSPSMSADAFKTTLEKKADEARDLEIEKLRTSYEKKISSLKTKLEKEERELEEDQVDLKMRGLQEIATHGENLLGLFTGSRSQRRISSSLSKRRMTAKAKADVKESEEAIAALTRQLEEIEAELVEKIDELDDRWDAIVAEVQERVVKPYKKDILSDLFGVAWLPYWHLESAGRNLEVAAYAAPENR